MPVPFGGGRCSRSRTADPAIGGIQPLEPTLGRKLQIVSDRVRRSLTNLANQCALKVEATQDPEWVLEQRERFAARIVAKYGSDSILAARVKFGVSLQLGAMGRWDQAASLRVESLEIFSEQLGESESETIQTEVGLAIALAHVGDWVGAETHLEHAVEASDRFLSPNDEAAVLAHQKFGEFQARRTGR